MKVNVSDKYSSLLRFGTNYARKKFCSIGPRVRPIKHFTLVIKLERFTVGHFYPSLTFASSSKPTPVKPIVRVGTSFDCERVKSPDKDKRGSLLICSVFTTVKHFRV